MLISFQDKAFKGLILNRRCAQIYLLIICFLHISDIPAEAILELFGKTFFEFCQDSGYDKILQVLGATPRDFLQVNIF